MNRKGRIAGAARLRTSFTVRSLAVGMITESSGYFGNDLLEGGLLPDRLLNSKVTPTRRSNLVAEIDSVCLVREREKSTEGDFGKRMAIQKEIKFLEALSEAIRKCR